MITLPFPAAVPETIVGEPRQSVRGVFMQLVAVGALQHQVIDIGKKIRDRGMMGLFFPSQVARKTQDEFPASGVHDLHSHERRSEDVPRIEKLDRNAVGDRYRPMIIDW